MRKLILQMQMSVDGYVSPANDIDWQLWGWGDRWAWDDRLKQAFNEVFAGVDTILLSRLIAEEGYLQHWGRTAKKYPADPHYAFARKIVDANKVVLTDKLKASSWERTVIASGGLAEEVNALKRQGGKDILTIGGVGFATALVSAGLVDEFQFFVNPTAVGAGLSVFADSENGHRLRLLRSDAYDCGMVVNRYAPLPVGAR